MHHSRLAGLIIDCSVDDLEMSAEFWSRALGRGRETSDAPEDAGYLLLEDHPGQPHIELQKVSHPSGVHLDIETDDVAAEVARLESLGAIPLRQVRDWWVMEAPSGQRFCVVPAEQPLDARSASQWITAMPDDGTR